MALIDISNLTFSYDNGLEPIFEKVSFQIDSNWKIGFIGRNGRGKTTFLKLLLGEFPYQGTIFSPLSFEYFPYKIPKELKSADEVLHHLLPACADWEIERELSLLQVEKNIRTHPFQTLSHGEQTKILLAALFLKDNSFPLIDEPTNHLDMDGRRLVSRYLKRKNGFLLVSHDRLFLDECIDHVLSINRTNIEIQRGNFSSFQKNQEQRNQHETLKNEQLKKEIKKLAKAAQQTGEWSQKAEKGKKGESAKARCGLRPDRGFVGHKAAKMARRSKNIEQRRQNALSEKENLLKGMETSEPLVLTPLPFPSNLFIEVSNLSVFYGVQKVLGPISFQIKAGERLLVSGKNGSGKSTLLKLITGSHTDYTGLLRIKNGLVLSYLPQDFSFLSGDLKNFAKQSDIDETCLKTVLQKLGFSRSQFDLDMEQFSDGQKKKVLLARSLCQKAHLYIWDEPLNYIDVISRMQIEELLLQSSFSMIFVEHDRAFSEKIATKILNL